MANTDPELRAVSPRQDPATRLLERCRSGDKEALGLLYHQHRGDVARTLYRVLGPGRDELEDTVQEVFIEVFRSIARFRGDAQLTTWLYRICINVALQRLRKRKRRSDQSAALTAEPKDDVTPQRRFEARERIAAVYRILDQLPPKKRVVFILHEIEGREIKEIAELVGAPAITVRTRLHYARKEFYARASLETVFAGEIA